MSVSSMLRPMLEARVTKTVELGGELLTLFLIKELALQIKKIFQTHTCQRIYTLVYSTQSYKLISKSLIILRAHLKFFGHGHNAN